MHAISVRPAARRLAISLAAAAVTTVLPATASAMPVNTTPPAPLTASVRAEAFQADLGRGVRAAQRRTELREKRAAARRAAELRAAEEARALADRIMDLAARDAGDPYVWGAAGPSAFDCSGYTMHVFGQLGIDLPHSSDAQAAMARPVSDPEVGDLVFFGGSNVYHVAIYAGDGYIWHAPRTGDVVKKERIWTGDVFYGRVS